MNQLYNRGVRPDLGLLPYQMPRMANDRAQRNQRMKNYTHIHRKDLSLVH